jgi:hypothetical protein
MSEPPPTPVSPTTSPTKKPGEDESDVLHGWQTVKSLLNSINELIQILLFEFVI